MTLELIPQTGPTDGIIEKSRQIISWNNEKRRSILEAEQMKKEMAGRRLSGLAVLILAVFLSVACSPAVEPQTRPAEEAEAAGETEKAAAAEKAEKAGA